MAEVSRLWAMVLLAGMCVVTVLGCELAPRRAAVPAAALPALGSHRLLDLPVASNLPQDVEVFVGISPAEELSRHLHWDRLLDVHPVLASRWTRTIEAKLGQPLLRVTDLAAVGIATDRPWGVALLDADRTIACLFAEIDDQVKLDAGVRQLARQHAVGLKVKTEGLATIAWTPALPELLIVRRGGLLFVVFGDAKPSRLHEQARRLALVSPARSLAGVAGFRALGREVGPGALVATYVRSAALAQKWLGIWDRQADPVFGSFSGAALGVWPAGDHLRIEGFLGLRPDSLIDRGLSTPRTPSGLHGLRDRSLVLSASLRRSMLEELLRAGYGATGDPAQAREGLAKRLQLNLETDVVGHLDGRLTLLVSSSDAPARPVLTTSVAADLLPGHEPARIIETWQRRAGDAGSLGPRPMAPYGLANQIVWSHGASPITDTETPIRGDPPLSRALVTVQHRPVMLAMTAHVSLLPVLGSDPPSATWQVLCEPLGVAALRADRAEGGLTLDGALFLRVSNLAAYAARVMARLASSSRSRSGSVQGDP